MGLLDDFARIGTAIVTGGTSELVRFIAPGIAEKATQLYFPTTPSQLLQTAALVALPIGISSAIVAQQKPGSTFDPRTNVFVGPTHGQPAASTAFLPGVAPVVVPTTGGSQMALNVGGLLSGIGSLLGGVSAVPAVQQFGGIVSQVGAGFQMQQPQQQLPQITGPPRLGAGAISTLSNEVITAGGKLLATLGIPVRSAGAFAGILKRTISALATLARRTPVGTLVSVLIGVGLSAFEANLLVGWHAQRRHHRRMNPGNAKALRRSIRRLRSFERLSARVSHQLSAVCRARPGVRRTTRRGIHCPVCRRSPCVC